MATSTTRAVCSESWTSVAVGREPPRRGPFSCSLPSVGMLRADAGGALSMRDAPRRPAAAVRRGASCGTRNRSVVVPESAATVRMRGPQPGGTRNWSVAGPGGRPNDRGRGRQGSGTRLRSVGWRTGPVPVIEDGRNVIRMCDSPSIPERSPINFHRGTQRERPLLPTGNTAFRTLPP